MNRFFLILFVIILSCQKETNKEIVLNDCLSNKQVAVLNEMINSFEKDICNYYNFPKNEVNKATKKYLNEFEEPIDSFILKVASNKSKELLKKSFNILSDDIWVTYADEEGLNTEDNIFLVGGDTLKLKEEIRKREKLLTKYKSKHLVNTNGKLINCFSQKTSTKFSKNLFDVVILSGNSRTLTKNLLKFNYKDFNLIEMRVYIALEYFYSPLDFNIK